MKKTDNENLMVIYIKKNGNSEGLYESSVTDVRVVAMKFLVGKIKRTEMQSFIGVKLCLKICCLMPTDSVTHSL